GRSVDETLGLTYWEITPDKYQEQEQLQLRFLEEKGSYGPYEKEYIHKDGSLVPVRLSGMLVEQKGERFIWSSVEDISALHQASMLERRLRQIFEYSYEEFYLFDGESLRFIQVSRGALDNLGYGPEEIEALTPLDLKTDYTPKDFAKLIAPLRHGKQPLLVFETRHRRKDGSFYPVEVRLQYSKEQGRSFFFAMIVDLTERRRIEKELADHRAHLEALVVQRTAQLEVANRELEAFSYSVSHDLRAPLRAIDGFSLALMEDYGQQPDETALDFLQRIRGGAQKMSQLIDDLLQLSRINKGELKWMPVDLAILAASVWEELQAVEPQREVELILGENLEVEGDPRQLRILLNNLLGNAWKFTSRKAQGRVVFERDHDDPSVFTIADNGAGFDMRYVDKLFGAFQRLHRTTEFPGTGVGLAIVQRIIHRHGGRIWAKGEVGHGATFYFSLGVGEVTQTRPLQENERGAYHA
ncbi:MAG TPA: PAS domain S-box protein, partial [Gammaproteobacteria bacterium]|nr:PAS domain S-box protein [Gammaproteobacteria bacterium]